MKLHIAGESYSSVFECVLNKAKNQDYHFLSFSVDSGLISCYWDGPVLKLVDFKLNLTPNGVKILILSSQLINSKGQLIADPENEKKFTNLFLEEYDDILLEDYLPVSTDIC